MAALFTDFSILLLLIGLFILVVLLVLDHIRGCGRVLYKPDGLCPFRLVDGVFVGVNAHPEQIQGDAMYLALDSVAFEYDRFHSR